MLRNILNREVPEIAAKHVESLFREMLHRRAEALRCDRLDSCTSPWPGREVLAAIQERLGLSERALSLSAGVLLDFGNVSSPFVVFVLERALAQNAPGGWWWMSSFGAGFSCHGALLKVE